MIERMFIEQGVRKVELDKYLRRHLERAGFTKSEIVKTPLVTRIVVNVVSPGLAIGKGGENIRMLTDEIKNRFGIDNPQLEIREIEQPYLDAQVMVDRIVSGVQRGFSWRSVCFRSIRDIMNAKARGAEITVKGVIAGKGQRKRKQRLAQGYMKKVGDQTKLVDYAKGTAVTKIGGIGFKVRIVRPDVWFPDKIDMTEYVAGKTPVVPEKESSEKASEETNAGLESQEAGKKTQKQTETAKKTKKEAVSSKKPAAKTQETAPPDSKTKPAPKTKEKPKSTPKETTKPAAKDSKEKAKEKPSPQGT